ncbi:hypothetical protein K438DRAFT_1861857 [Mycena galopus ATCC 62051]|nr:hypothetical protein K438DRAFT_1861857 [Mycena galopus ATCC 62051]
MFQLRLLRWIRGTGYPRSIRAKYITAEEYKAHRNDPLIRAQRLLFSMTERYAVPLDPDFHLTVCRSLPSMTRDQSHLLCRCAFIASQRRENTIFTSAIVFTLSRFL